jgi:predicted acyltransferase
MQKNMDSKVQLKQEQNRILSIDFFRGFTMFMLVTGITGVFFEFVDKGKGGAVISFLAKQLEHAEWNGLYAWDLIQPFFMFIVGVAMPFSLTKRLARGDSWNKVLRHALTRSFMLLLFGFMLHAYGDSFTLTNVLAQLSVTYLVAFLMMRLDVKWQLVISFGLILISDLLYRFWPVEGFNQPFTADHNFGSWVDTALTGRLAEDRWVAFNAIPTSAHTIWGVLVGYILMKDWPHRKKILTMLIPGIIAVIIGYLMNPYIPIIKRICTSSFVIVSGGYCLIAMAFSYWVIDVLKARNLGLFFAIVGMNPIFIYLFSNLGGHHLLDRMAIPFTSRLFGWGGELTVNVVTILVIAAMVWYICYFLYKRRIFIKI